MKDLKDLRLLSRKKTSIHEQSCPFSDLNFLKLHTKFILVMLLTVLEFRRKIKSQSNDKSYSINNININ